MVVLLPILVRMPLALALLVKGTQEELEEPTALPGETAVVAVVLPLLVLTTLERLVEMEVLVVLRP